MKFKVITLFPEIIESLKNYSIIGRAIKNKTISVETIQIRDFGLGKYKQVDDKPYGGGVGMLFRVDVIHQAIKKASPRKNNRRRIILLSPEGERFNQDIAKRLSKYNEVVLICGHYEGFDRRIDDFIDEKISIGDFVLTGGEIPAMAMIDSISRLQTGVLGKEESIETESFDEIDGRKVLEYPQYTRPEKYLNLNVPDVLLSGDHKKIESWKKEHLTEI